MFGFTSYSQAAYSDDGVVNVAVSLTGVAGTGQVGDAEAKIVALALLTGVSATGEVGDVLLPNTGVIPTGVEATGGIGDLSIVGDSTLTPIEPLGTGTGQVGTLTMTGDANLSLTGVAGTGAVGDALAKINVSVALTGLEATGAVGDVTTSAGSVVSPTGLSANAFVGPEIVFSGVGDAQISTAQYKFGGASLLLDGTGDSVVSDGTYNFGGDPFTVDMWVRPTSGTQDGIFFDSRDSTSNDTIALRQSSDNLLVLRGNATLFNINAVFSVDTWVHIAVTRGDPFGNTYSVFVDGVKQDSTLFGVTATAADIHIGSDFNGSNNWEGYIDELRVSTVDQYDGSDFTPETSEYTSSANSPVLLHFDGTNGSTDFVNSGSVDVVTVTGDAVVPQTGLEATGNVGSVTVVSDAIVSPTGVEATGEIGDVTVTGGTGITVVVTGVQSTGAVGTATASGGAVVSVTGLEATGGVGQVIVWGRIVPEPGTVYSEIEPSVPTTWTDIAA